LPGFRKKSSISGNLISELRLSNRVFQYINLYSSLIVRTVQTDTVHRFYCHVYGVTVDGLLNWVLDLLISLNTQQVITVNYSDIANFHTLPTTLSFPASSVFTRRFLITASNNGYSSVSGLKSSLNGGPIPNGYSCSNCFPYRVENTVFNNTSIVACLSVAVGSCSVLSPFSTIWALIGDLHFNIISVINWYHAQ
jgi:hypothetical protein